MPTQTPILGLYNPLDADDANTAVRVWRTADNAVLDAAVGTARQNLLSNPGLETWQRGAGPFSANLAYTADRWQIGVATSTVSVTRIASTIGSNGYSLQAVYTHVGGGYLTLDQKLEDYLQLRGKAVTFAVSLKASVAGTVVARIATNLGVLVATAANAGTAEERLICTGTVPTGATSIICSIVAQTASATIEINDATLCVGSSALAYAPLHPADDLARSLRYYEVHGGATNKFPFVAFSAQAGSHTIAWPIGFKVVKAITPTLTKSGTWTVANCAQPAADLPDAQGYRLYIVSSGAGAGNAQPADATCTVVAESNP